MKKDVEIDSPETVSENEDNDTSSGHIKIKIRQRKRSKNLTKEEIIISSIVTKKGQKLFEHDVTNC